MRVFRLGAPLRAAHPARRVHARRIALALPAPAGGQPVPLHQRGRRALGAGGRRAGRARLPAVGARLTRIPTRCASPSTATRCCSPTRPSASSRARGWMLPAPRACAPPRRSRRGRSSRCRGAAATAARAGARHAHPHRAGDGAQRAGARARHPHADGLAHRRRRGDVPRRSPKGEFLREFEPVSSSTTRPATSRTPRRTCRRARRGRRD